MTSETSDSKKAVSLAVHNKLTGRNIAQWTGFEDEMPTAWEVWDMLCAAFPVVLVNEDGTLHSTM